MKIIRIVVFVFLIGSLVYLHGRKQLDAGAADGRSAQFAARIDRMIRHFRRGPEYYAESCRRFQHAICVPLAVEPEDVSAELDEFMEYCLSKKDGPEHELAGCAYTVAERLRNLLDARAGFASEYEEIQNRDYSEEHAPGAAGTDALTDRSGEERREFWLRSVERKWEGAVARLKQQNASYFPHMDKLAAQ